MSMRGSNFLITPKILVKQSTADKRLKGSGWLELLSIRLMRDLMLAGFSLKSLVLMCFRLHHANSAIAFEHISRKVELFRLCAPSISASKSDSTEGCS